MQKIEIAERIHQQAGISEQEAATLLDWILELFKVTLQKGEPIAIPNFGKFAVLSKAPRKGRNPRTGEELMIKARRVIFFRASTHLTDEMNAVQAEKQETVMPTV